VRGWMVAARLCKAQPHELVEHFWRPRRSACGELVQWETSNHDWPRGRGAVVRCLVKWTDDAPSRSGRGFAHHGRHSPIASEPTPSPRLWAAAPGTTPAL